MITLAGPADLTREAVEAVAWGGERLALAPAVLERVAAGQAELAALLAGGARVYGVNTGMGWLASVDLDPAAQAGHQRNLLLGRAVAGPPWLPAAEARALLVTRLANLVSGHAGVGPELCRFLVDRIDDGFVPAVPRRGFGGAGEVIPLAHAFQTLTGAGLVLEDGGTADAGRALAERGVLPYRLQAKEGIALLAGSPLAAALALARLRAGERLAGQLLASAAAAVDALGAPLDAYDEAVGRLAGDPLLEEVLADLRRATGRRTAPVLQAPVSFRVAPQVLAQLRRTLGRLDEDVRRALSAVTDSPALVDGRVVAGGGFHAVGLAAAMDGLAVALVQAAELAGQRLHRLLDGRFSGLADQLSPDPGPVTGLVLVQKRAVGALAEARRLAAPAAVGLADTSLGQEDAASFAPEAAEQLRRVEELVREVVACELLAARQAWWLRAARRDPGPARRDTGRPGGPAPGLAGLAGCLEELVAPVERDRPLGPDLARLVEALEGDELPLP
ncbi:MAG TPA: aromatic amino acid lyase [Actinomycetota bacterium]|nr:aromatic amino acid lyase [Actinomycetota bacterium]